MYGIVHGLELPQLFLTPYILFSAVLYAVGTVLYFKAYKHIGAAEVTVIGGAGVIVTIIASALFLHDRLTLLQLFGVFLILSAVVLVNISKSRFSLNKGAYYALFGAGAYGLAVVSDSFIVHHYDPFSYLPLNCFIPGILLLVWYIKHVKKIYVSARHINKNLVIFTTLYSIQAISFYVALRVGALVAQMSAISRASIILTVVLAAIFLKERKHLVLTILAAFFTTIGVLLVTA